MLTVKSSNSNYAVHIKNVWSGLAEALPRHFSGKKALIVCDSALKDYFLPPVMSEIAPNFSACTSYILPTGEKNKNMMQLIYMLRAFSEADLARDSVVFALGGGVCGDITGFAASVYMRGIAYVGVPTTLLSMVDSSIGGKTGVDFGDIKNLVGSFHAPSMVYMNASLINFLVDKHYISGLAEVIKYGIIRDGLLFEKIISQKDAILQRNPFVMPEIIYECCRIKAQIVEADEKEAGLRMVLNYGHTFGHAIEALSGFKIPHGYAVAIGMVCAARFSHNMGGMTQADVKRIINLLDFFGLPVALPSSCSFSAEDVYNMMLKDKKASDEGLTLIVSHKIGSADIMKGVNKADVLSVIETIFNTQENN